MPDLMPYLLGAVLGGFLLFPAGYLARVALSNAANNSPRSPCEDEILASVAGVLEEQEKLWSTYGEIPQKMADLSHEVQLMKQEWDDFYEKTRKSEERNRKRVAAQRDRDEDDEDGSEADQLLMQVMQQQQDEQTAPADDLFSRAAAQRPRGQRGG